MPGTPTTIHGIPTMAGGDAINQIDEWTVAAGAAIDGKLAPSTQGLLSARPAAGKLGQTYKATDTGQYFRDNGTTWDEAVFVGSPQQAWQAITLTGFNSGDANGDGQPDNVVHYYKDSLGMVHFRGDFTQAASPAVASTLCTMPAGYRVGADQYLPLVIVNGSGSASVIARSDGTIKVVSALGTITWSWSSIHYRAEN